MTMHGPLNVEIDGDTVLVRHTCVALYLLSLAGGVKWLF